MVDVIQEFTTLVTRDTTTGKPVPNMLLTGSNVTDVVFHDAATVTGQGGVFTVDGYKTLTVEVYGTAATLTVAFKATGPSGTARTLMGAKLSDLSTGTSSSALGEFWQFDVTGLSTVIMDLTAVTGGNVSVKGKAVA